MANVTAKITAAVRIPCQLHEPSHSVKNRFI
jgi:hypothetical protein